MFDLLKRIWWNPKKDDTSEHRKYTLLYEDLCQ